MRCLVAFFSSVFGSDNDLLFCCCLVSVLMLRDEDDLNYSTSHKREQKRRQTLMYVGIAILVWDLLAMVLYSMKPNLSWQMPPLTLALK